MRRQRLSVPALAVVVGAGAFAVACAGIPSNGTGAAPVDASGAAADGPVESDAGTVVLADASAVDATLPPPLPPLDAGPGPTSDGAPADASADGSADAADAANATPLTCAAAGSIVSWMNGHVRVDYDLSAGTASFFYDGAKKIADFYAGVSLPTYTTSRQYTSHVCAATGTTASITSTASGLPTMVQWFTLSGGNKFLAQLTVQAAAGGTVAANWIAPVVMSTTGGLDVGSYRDVRLLWVPFDNDAWVSYNALPVASSGTSFEAAAIYDNVTRNGVVVGSVTPDRWKSGVYYSGSNDRLDALNVFGGAVDPTWTHDPLPHGTVSGSSIASPVMFVGYGADWRDLMEEYGDANLAFQTQLPWSGGVPFGWNSWGQIQSKISYDAAAGVSDFIAQNLQASGFSNEGAVYINLDSYWDNLSSSELAMFAAHCHANGQKAGIYWAPFVDWGESATRQVEGTSYTYSQIWLQDAKGNPIAVDGAYAVDPTHPGTKGRIDTFIDMFQGEGLRIREARLLEPRRAREHRPRRPERPHRDSGVQPGNEVHRGPDRRDDVHQRVDRAALPVRLRPWGAASRCDTYRSSSNPAATNAHCPSAAGRRSAR